MTKKLLIIILIVAVAGGAVIGGTFVWRYWQVSEQEEEPEVEIPTDWKAYRNEEYGFEMKYPVNWEISCQPFRLRECTELFHSPDYKTALAGEVKKRQEVITGANITLNITQIPSDWTWEDWAQRPMDTSGKLISSEQINLNNNLSWKMLFINEYLQPPRKYINIAFPSSDQEKLYEFTLSIVADDENEQEYRNIFNQMLSTFKFIK